MRWLINMICWFVPHKKWRHKIKNNLISFSYNRFILYRCIARVFLKKPLVVIKVDGGICSQINFYLLGCHFVSKGYVVKYDLSWFVEDGKDMNGRFERNFDLLKAFPYLTIDEITKQECAPYKSFFYFKEKDITDGLFITQKPPIYLDLYYNYHMLYDNYLKTLNFLDIILDDQNIRILEDIKLTNSVAVHVRRGDMVLDNGSGWGDINSDYFINAISILSARVEKPKFFFFSDEIDWVKTSILPSLADELEYTCIQNNGSDKGYIDLSLIASCKHQIASQGSLGKFGAMINKNPDKIVIAFKDAIEYLPAFGSAIIMDNDNIIHPINFD